MLGTVSLASLPLLPSHGPKAVHSPFLPLLGDQPTLLNIMFGVQGSKGQVKFNSVVNIIISTKGGDYPLLTVLKRLVSLCFQGRCLGTQTQPPKRLADG